MFINYKPKIDKAAMESHKKKSDAIIANVPTALTRQIYNFDGSQSRTYLATLRQHSNKNEDVVEKDSVQPFEHGKYKKMMIVKPQIQRVKNKGAKPPAKNHFFNSQAITINNRLTEKIQTVEHLVPFKPTYIKPLTMQLGTPMTSLKIIDSCKEVVKEYAVPESFLAQRLKDSGIRKIHHIYQEKYSGDVSATGLGDFIRGCLFLVQFCLEYGFDYQITVNHPISQYLNDGFIDQSNIATPFLQYSLKMFVKNNWQETVFNNEQYIKQFLLSRAVEEEYIDYLCSLPLTGDGEVQSYSIMFPYKALAEEETQVLQQQVFCPSPPMAEYIDQVLVQLELEEERYIVIHVRSGDSHLIQGSRSSIFQSGYYDSVKREILSVLQLKENRGKPVLLLADNNDIKILLHQSFPAFKFLGGEITHLGEGVRLSEDSVKNTMLDFFLLAKSLRIYATSVYIHGSGFSYWCAKLFGKPYRCKFIK